MKFSLNHKDSDIFVKRDMKTAIVREYKKKRRDRFILVELKEPLRDKPLEWKFKVITLRSEWFAVGITDESNVFS